MVTTRVIRFSTNVATRYRTTYLPSSLFSPIPPDKSQSRRGRRRLLDHLSEKSRELGVRKNAGGRLHNDPHRIATQSYLACRHFAHLEGWSTGDKHIPCDLQSI
jgi:hypothetical protein